MSIELEALKMLATNYRSRLERIANMRAPEPPEGLTSEEGAGFREGVQATIEALSKEFGDIARDEAALHKGAKA